MFIVIVVGEQEAGGWKGVWQGRRVAMAIRKAGDKRGRCYGTTLDQLYGQKTEAYAILSLYCFMCVDSQ